MNKSILIASLALTIAPAAWAQNTVVPGQWAQDLGAPGPQRPNAVNASGIVGSTTSCRSDTGMSCGGVTGAAPNRHVGSGSPVAPQNDPNATASTTMTRQTMKQLETYKLAQGDDPRRACLTDENGFLYNCRGQRLR